MMANAMESTWMIQWGWILLHSVWQFSLIAIGVRAANRLHAESPVARHWFSFAGLLLIVLCPAVTWWISTNTLLLNSQAWLTELVPSSSLKSHAVRNKRRPDLPIPTGWRQRCTGPGRTSGIVKGQWRFVTQTHGRSNSKDVLRIHANIVWLTTRTDSPSWCTFATAKGESVHKRAGTTLHLPALRRRR